MAYIICKTCNKSFNYSIKIGEKLINSTKRKRCWECSPYRYHNSVKPEDNFHLITKRCSKCKEIKNGNDFRTWKAKHGRTVLAGSCKSCDTRADVVKRKIKLISIAYKGGKCSICGYCACAAALDFHHRDKKLKKFGICQYLKRTFTKELIEELDKCDLLCANCHRALETKNCTIPENYSFEEEYKAIAEAKINFDH